VHDNLTKIEVNYKNKKRYKTAKYPIRQPKFLTWLIWVLSKIMLIGKKYKVERINMDNLKGPYILLSNHLYFVDFELISVGTYPQRMNNVVHVDGYYRRPWLLELIGSIATRKFTNDMHLVKSINKVISRGDVACIYPEARYSACGITSYIPDSVGKIVKMNKVPLVIAIHRGNHLHTPFWNFRKKRKVPLHTTITQVLTAEQVKSMSVEEINKVIKENFVYDEYKYQKDNNILITEKYRAEGIHKILYQCPHCLTESKMASKGTELYCEECGKRWNLNEDGTLTALNGETEFSHVPDWYNWEREQVRKQVLNGTYHFEDEVDVYSFPRCWRFIHLGKAKVTHTIENGFVLEGFYRNEPYRIIRKPLDSNSLHIEYDYCYIKPYDCFDISCEDDQYNCYTTKPNVITKLGFAVEEIYQLKLKEKQNK
jgi:hypothetical protein